MLHGVPQSHKRKRVVRGLSDPRGTSSDRDASCRKVVNRGKVQSLTHQVHPGMDVLVIGRDLRLHGCIEVVKLGKNSNVRKGHAVEDETLFPGKQYFQVP